MPDPQFADVEASVLQRHVAVQFDDLLDGLQHVSSHGHVPTHVNVPPLLSQISIHRLGQLLAKDILDIFLRRKKRRMVMRT